MNVARVIAQMEEAVLATGVIGGTIGEYIIQELNKNNIPNDFLKIKKNQEIVLPFFMKGCKQRF